MRMMTSILPLMTAWLHDEEGASLVEYILLVALVAVVSIAAITFLGKSARDKFNFTANTINSAS
jgi:pilus assembly protein Flp/PilA